MSTLEKTITPTSSNKIEEELLVQDWTLYGSSRLGQLKASGLSAGKAQFKHIGKDATGAYIRGVDYYIQPYLRKPVLDQSSSSITHQLGLKRYELTNHLGNVMAVINDRKLFRAPLSQLPELAGLPEPNYLQAEVVGAWDYYPFGSLMPGRQFISSEYRCGFNGKEMDDEIKGSGNSLDFGARIYDPRLGRWLSIDPLATKYPSQSSYISFANNPLLFVDKDGQENTIYLYDLRLTKPGLSKTEKNKIIHEMQDIAAKANSGFKTKQKTQRVVVIDFIPSAKSLEKSDVLATIGTQDQLAKFDQKYGDANGKNPNKFDLVGISGMGPERSTGTWDGDQGDRIALDRDQINSDYSVPFNFPSPNEFAAWLIQHGSGHNADIGHSDVKEGDSKQSNEKRDLMTSGDGLLGAKGAGIGFRNKVSPVLRGLFQQKKFTRNPANDNLKRSNL